ncbi:cell division protein FtsA [Candidatus Synchoanobacter obligatus]|uniref:Cell division protein FtsA n=1 Tax=Candidatus Synchoanobacter obligatus TaxID=2919597 RepID=A0ABT1L4F6_9GAMM|nr:cell division protein FtsA [Candidatus Synchoanobacter obligatus]MCP8352046.1 cell division protein FtsA [Candidatus Synchoanobacter obligatus]
MKSPIVVIDFGTSSARILVAEDDPRARVLAYESMPSLGVNHGVIVDLEKAAETIQHLISKVKKKIDIRFNRVYCTVSGDSISSVNSHGVVKIRHQEVTPYDLDELSVTAQALALDNQVVVHMLPQSYKVDNQAGIIDPKGMFGVRLEGSFNLVLADQGAAQNMSRCLERVGLTCSGLIFPPIGLAAAVLTQDEKQQGVVVLDMGEGTTDCVVLYGGVVVFSASIPIGGAAVSHDIAHLLQVNNDTAEKIKKLMGLADEEEAYMGVSSDKIREVIDARYAQIIKLVDRCLVREGLKQKVNRGYVLCGGAMRYPGVSDIIESFLGKQSRQGSLVGASDSSMHQDWLSAAGLVYYIQQQAGSPIHSRNNPCRHAFKMIQRWLEVYF